MAQRSIGKTLRRLRENAGLSADDVGNALSRQGKTINAWENGRGEPDITALITLSTLFGVKNLLSLIAVDLYGDTAPIRPEINETEDRLISDWRTLDRFGRQTVIKVIESELERVRFISDDPEQKAAYAPYLEIPLSRQPIFPGCDFPERELFDTVEFIKIPKTDLHKSVDFAVRIDSSGFEPRFSDGDILLIKRQSEIDIGEIGIFSVDDRIFLRGFGHNRLISVTPGLEDILINEKKRVRCLGKLITKA
ncbi:MAG: helix-turn-helix domain-containing protein [Ruminococcus sp.]|jgi:transcriptional regulator with XRE-family HTH domain|nr:helix-turn-helix domain-containing protein [Ruminococcus sp.]